MKERDFILELEKRAKEEETLIKRMSMSKTFVYLSLWFGKHPWRIIIPFSILLTIIFRLIFGKTYFELILWIFGGL